MSKFPMPKAFGMVTVGERGQVVIPANVRKVYNINPGDKLIVLADKDRPIGLVPVEQFNEFLSHTAEMLAKIKKSTG